MIESATQLFAVAAGVDISGPYQCLFCGTPARARYDLKDTFTARDTLAIRGSEYVCSGCALCLEESGVAEYPDGTEKTWTKAFRRCHSWTVTANGATPYTGAHAASLRRFLLSPPAPPWAACLVAPTNGRQLLYLTPLNIDPVAWSVLVEGERVAYTRDSLRRRLGLTLGLASCGGLPSLDGPPKVALASAVILAHGERGESWLAEWSRVHSEPLSRLAIYLTPKREDCARVISTLGSAAGGD